MRPDDKVREQALKSLAARAATTVHILREAPSGLKPRCALQLKVHGNSRLSKKFVHERFARFRMGEQLGVNRRRYYETSFVLRQSETSGHVRCYYFL